MRKGEEMRGKRQVGLVTMEWVAVLKSCGARILYPKDSLFDIRDAEYTGGIRVSGDGVVHETELSKQRAENLRLAVMASSFLLMGVDMDLGAITVAMAHRKNAAEAVHAMLNVAKYMQSNVLFLLGTVELTTDREEYYENSFGGFGYRAFVCTPPEEGDELKDVLHLAHFSSGDNGSVYIVTRPLNDEPEIMHISGENVGYDNAQLSPVIEYSSNPSVLEKTILTVQDAKQKMLKASNTSSVVVLKGDDDDR